MINPATGQEDPNYVAPTTPAGGLLNPPPATTAPATTDIGAAQGQAKTWEVTPNQTVQGQVEGLLKKDSPLSQFGAAQAMSQANKRGLLGSSIAVGEAQNAMYQNAIPIATSDAATYADAAKTNSASSNQYGLAAQQQGFNVANMDQAAGIALKMYDTQLQGDMEKMAKAQGYSLETMNEQQVLDLGKAAVMQGYEVANKLADRDTQLAVNKLLTDNKLLVDTNATAQKVLSEYSTALTAIANNKDLSGVPDPATGISPKQAAINNAAQALKNSLTILSSISGIKFDDLLDFGDSGYADNEVAGTSTPEETADNIATDLESRQAAWDAAPEIRNRFGQLSDTRNVGGQLVTRPTE